MPGARHPALVLPAAVLALIALASCAGRSSATGAAESSAVSTSPAVSTSSATSSEPSELTTSSETPSVIVPSHPPADAAALQLCLSRSGYYAMGDPMAQSGPPEMWHQYALADLAAYLIIDNPTTLAATLVFDPALMSATTPVYTVSAAVQIQVVPANDGVDVDQLVSAAIGRLIPQFQGVVSTADVQVAAPAGFSFADSCAAYAAVDELAMQSQGTNAIPFESLSLARDTGAVVIGVVTGQESPQIAELRAEFAPIVQVEWLPTDYQQPTLE